MKLNSFRGTLDGPPKRCGKGIAVVPGVLSATYDAPIQRALVWWSRSDQLVRVSGAAVTSWGNLVAPGSTALLPVAGHAPAHVVSRLPYLNCGVAGSYSKLLFPAAAFAALTKAEGYTVQSQNLQPVSTGTGALYDLGKGDGPSPYTYAPYSGDQKVYSNFGTNLRKDALGNLTGDARVAPNKPYCTHMQSAPASWSMWINGTILTNIGANTVAFNPGQNSLFAIDAAQYFFGRFYEVAIYSDTLTASEQAHNDAYFARRYGY